MRGGAAKACISASALYGSVSGSPSADVATTGPLTIPIMKKSGVSAIRAGAIEATASTGGAILPPVMGAVAFIMSDITNIPYATIAWAATPASILYYVSLYLLVHIDAIRFGEGELPAEDRVTLRRALIDGWVFFLPLGRHDRAAGNGLHADLRGGRFDRSRSSPSPGSPRPTPSGRATSSPPASRPSPSSCR